MSFQDRLASQNVGQLVSIGAGLGLVLAATGTGQYNFPLMLFGLVGLEITSSTALLRQFLFLVFASMWLEVFTIFFQSGFAFILSIAIFVIKLPILFSTIETLKQRGETIQMPGYGGFPSMGGYNHAEQGQGQSQGQASWNIPGGFGGAPAQQAPTPAPPAQFPSSGGYRLGDESDSPQSGGAATGGGGGKGPQPGRGGYQTID